jgi:hypothetical protein
MSRLMDHIAGLFCSAIALESFFQHRFYLAGALTFSALTNLVNYAKRGT